MHINRFNIVFEHSLKVIGDNVIVCLVYYGFNAFVRRFFEFMKEKNLIT